MDMVEDTGEFLALGNFLGRLMEGFPQQIRMNAIKDMKEMESRMAVSREYAKIPKLTPQLLKIEIYRKVKTLYPFLIITVTHISEVHKFTSNLYSGPQEVRRRKKKDEQLQQGSRSLHC